MGTSSIGTATPVMVTPSSTFIEIAPGLSPKRLMNSPSKII
jgi:hypothetical protein